MNVKETMGFLGICRKAGKLLCGHDVVKDSVVKNKAQLVFLSADASERLEREMQYLCTDKGKDIPVVRTTLQMSEFAIGIGKKSAVFSVTDFGFSQKLLQKFREELHDN